MDDAIVLSDDDDECICIEESTVVTESSQKTCSTSFSLVDAVNKRRSRRIAMEKKTSLDDEMDELDRMIEEQRAKNAGSSKPFECSFDVDFNIASTSSEVKITETKKRKIIEEDDKEKQKEKKENAKRAREAGKEKKATEKDKEKNEAMRKREEKEREKETKKIEREISAALNTKCEQYTFCHVGRNVLDTLPGLEAEIRMLFTERKIENQLRIERDLGTRIEWRRKCIELREDEDGRSERFEYSSTQDLFAVVVPAATLKDVIASNSLSDFIVEQRTGFQNGRCTMLIVSFGKLDITKKKLHNLSVELYETHRAQIVQLDNISELALFTAQYLRSLSRRGKKRLEANKEEESSSGGHKVQYHGEKGIVLGSRAEIVSDWWSKMLATIDRLSDAQRRAILKLIPDPIVAIDKYSKIDYSTAVREIGDLVAENGRRVGPAMAHRILKMLTDETGTEVVD
ncbi:unnamed protein product [Caenorhabditis sp. 36 PRJEB53466]|nr:unnamed protein product [Caenorhabditis sp. 36 PRJEB53466]